MTCQRAKVSSQLAKGSLIAHVRCSLCLYTDPETAIDQLWGGQA